jgi:hypothetical protein
MSMLARAVVFLLVCSPSLLSQNTEVPSIPNDLIWEPNVEYWATGGRHERLEMDVVRPRDIKGTAPAVVLIHGGGFRAGTSRAICRCALSWPNVATWLPLCPIGFHPATNFRPRPMMSRQPFAGCGPMLGVLE